jgi:hypothetical protein
VTVPTNASAGVTLGSTTNSVTIGLPYAAHAARAVKRGSGVVSYDNNNGSSTVPIVQKDGSVQIDTVIHGASAPSRYSYSMDMPAGASMKIHSDGSAIATDPLGAPLFFVAAPWAKDATGAVVATHYEIVGNILTQVVDHNVQGVRYPVVADPKVTWFAWSATFKLTKAETKKVASATSNAGALAVLCGLIASAPGAIVCGIAGYIASAVSVSMMKAIMSRGHCLQYSMVWLVGSFSYEVTC